MHSHQCRARQPTYAQPATAICWKLQPAQQQPVLELEQQQSVLQQQVQ
jgi:hypothetical protein